MTASPPAIESGTSGSERESAASDARRTSSLRHRPRRVGSARLAQETEGASSRLIKTPDRISEGPPRGGLSRSRSGLGTSTELRALEFRRD